LRSTGFAVSQYVASQFQKGKKYCFAVFFLTGTNCLCWDEVDLPVNDFDKFKIARERHKNRTFLELKKKHFSQFEFVENAILSA